MPVAFDPNLYVVINDVMIGTPACRLLDDTDLLRWAAVRGDNTAVPGRHGRVNNAKPDDERDVLLGCQAHGYWDEDGDPTTGDPGGRVREYLMALEARLGKGLASVSFEWHQHDLPVIGGDVQVVGISRPGFGAPAVADFGIELIVPPGRDLEELGS